MSTQNTLTPETGDAWETDAPASPTPGATPVETATEAQPTPGDAANVEAAAARLKKALDELAKNEPEQPGFTTGPLPTDLKGALELVQQLRATPIPVRNGRQDVQFARHLAKALAEAEQNYARLQQGLPVIHITAQQFGDSHTRNHEDTQRQKWEIMSRGNVDIQLLLKAYDALKKENAELNALIAATK